MGGESQFLTGLLTGCTVLGMLAGCTTEHHRAVSSVDLNGPPIEKSSRLYGPQPADQPGLHSAVKPDAIPENEQALIVWLRLSNNYTGSEHDKEIVEQLATDLNVALAPDNAGEVESKALVDGYGILYMYGADADKIASLALPVIRKLQPRPGSYAVLRYGPSGNPSVRTKRVLLRD